MAKGVCLCVCVFVFGHVVAFREVFRLVQFCSVLFKCAQRLTRGLDRQALAKVTSCAVLLFSASVQELAFTRARGAG